MAAALESTAREQLDGQVQPAWLEGSQNSHAWTIWDTDRLESKQLSFVVQFADQTQLTDPENSHWLALVKQYAIFGRETGTFRCRTANIHCDEVGRLLHLLQWTRLRGIRRLDGLVQEHAEAFVGDMRFGVGYALRWFERLTAFFDQEREALPIRSDNGGRRNFLDVEKVCSMVAIPYHALSGDVRARYAITKASSEAGYITPQQKRFLSTCGGVVPEPQLVTEATFLRSCSVFGKLWRVRKYLAGDRLSFCPDIDLGREYAGKMTRVQRTRNIPIETAMHLLDRAVRWVTRYGPELLDVADRAFATYETAVNEAERGDSASSPVRAHLIAAVALQHVHLSRELVKQRPNGAAALARYINEPTARVNDYLRGQSRTLSRNEKLLDFVRRDVLIHGVSAREVRERLDTNAALNASESPSIARLAMHLRSNTLTLKRLLEMPEGGDPRVLARLERLLIDKGWEVLRCECREPSSGNVFRADRGIPLAVTMTLKSHSPVHVGPGSPWPLSWNLAAPSRSPNWSLYDALTIGIPMSCFIVLAVFTARRRSEISTLRAGCYVSDDAGFGFLDVFIRKTLRAHVFLPVPELVERSIRLLERWSSRARQESGQSELFQYMSPVGELGSMERLGKSLASFARMVGLELDDIRLEARQFRRFFAMTYFWRYKSGQLEDLSYFLRHRSIAMTRVYVTEFVSGEVMQEVQSEVTAKIFHEAALGKLRLAGAFGRTVTRYLERQTGAIRANLELRGPDESEVKALCDKLVATGRMFNPLPWGGCYAGDRLRDHARARCADRSVGIPQKRQELSSPSMCVACPHYATDSEYEAYLRTELSKEISAATDVLLPTGVAKAAEKRAALLRKFIEKNFLA